MSRTIAPQLPAILDVEIVQGDEWELSLDFDIPLTGYTITGTIHKRGGGTVALTKTDVDLAEGQFKLKLAVAESALLATVEHTWCLVMTPPGSTATRTYISGKFTVRACA